MPCVKMPGRNIVANNIKKVVLAYSGGLDTSVILKWLVETYACQVVTMTADLGQEEDLRGVEEKALRTGASKAYVEDLREEFARDYVFPMLRSGVVYEGRYLLGTSIARPLIARRLVEIARAEGADALAHGATGKGNDQVRFELAATALAPELRVIAPWREWDLHSRGELNAYALARGIPVNGNNKRYSIDRNMLHCSFEGSELEDPWNEPDLAAHALCAPLERTPDAPEEITLDFEKGDPVALNGRRLAPAALLAELNRLGGRHGIGRVDMVENRCVGMKSHGVYETPGGTVIRAAHQDLEGICLDRAAMRVRDVILPFYADAVYNGCWFSPERDAMQAFMDKAQERVRGTVRLRLFKGQAAPVGRKSPCSLYDNALASFEGDGGYNQQDAAGFIRLSGLRLRGYMNEAV